ncbi:unnamed protein product [Prunus armeniaca]
MLLMHMNIRWRLLKLVRHPSPMLILRPCSSVLSNVPSCGPNSVGFVLGRRGSIDGEDLFLGAE